MKLGCGCVVALLVLAVLAAGTTWAVVQMLRAPDVVPAAATPAEGKAAQEKLYAIISRSDRPRQAKGPPRPIVLSEREVNAFLSRHLGQVGELPLTDIAVRLPAPGRIEMIGRVPLRHLLGGRLLTSAGEALPQRWRDRLVWLHVEAEASVEVTATGRRRYLRFDVRRFLIGRQAFPSVVPQLMLDSETLRLLRWPLPEAVNDVRIEPGRAVVTTAS